MDAQTLARSPTGTNLPDVDELSQDELAALDHDTLAALIETHTDAKLAAATRLTKLNHAVAFKLGAQDTPGTFREGPLKVVVGKRVSWNQQGLADSGHALVTTKTTYTVAEKAYNAALPTERAKLDAYRTVFNTAPKVEVVQ